jgi:cysteine sulfinate desulfinase/cysteine desulfurase-like protein/predicted MFS family arabinose efflux permease
VTATVEPTTGHPTTDAAVDGGHVRLGLRENLPQFVLLVAVNALVGGMVGQERTVLPLLAEREFGLTDLTFTVSFVAAFGVVKAATNFFAGMLSDRWGRKPVLVAGWLVGLPVPLLIIWAPSWGWVVAANVLLGVNQGLTWSTTVIMKIDLAGPGRRGLAMGLNEAAGYGAVAVTAVATGAIAEEWGLRPGPFLLGLAYAALGLGLSAVVVRETRGHAHLEARNHVARSAGLDAGLSTRQVFVLTSFRERALSAASQAGLVNNLNDGLAWGLFPLYFAAGGLSVRAIGVLAATYPAVWGLGQILTGPLSDRWGRRRLIAAGMGTQAVALALVAATTGFGPWAGALVLLGVGTAMVYPTLLAAIGDVAHPQWRASAVGVYRLWRDGGYAVGALLAGVVADAASIEAAIWVVAALTATSGAIVAVRMYETHPHTPSPTSTPGGAVAHTSASSDGQHPALEGRPIYLDYNRTTPVDPRVLDAALPYLTTEFGNPASAHHFARAPRQAIAEARQQLAALLGCGADDIVFTGGGSESDALALRGTALAHRERGDHIVTQVTEHPAVLAACRDLERHHGFEITYLPVDGHCHVDPADMQAAITDRTVLVSIMHANNETGTLQPITELAAVAHARGVLFHTDAAQSVGKIPTDVDALGVDLLTVAGHKLYAPKGVGALYVRPDTRIEALIGGGGQERGLRAGTENVASIAALGRAAQLSHYELPTSQTRLRELRDRLHRRLDEQFGPAAVQLNGHPTQRLPNTLNVSVDGVTGADLLAACPGLAAATGSACHEGDPDPSGVLLAMGLGPERARSAVRFSLGRWTTPTEIDQAAAILAAAYHPA